MKEVTLITTFKKHEKMIIQNNGMIGSLMNDVQQIQEMTAGFLGVIRKLPGYEKAINELAEEHAKREAEMKATELKEATEACKALKGECEGCIFCKPEPAMLAPEEAPKVLDLGKDD